MIVKLNYNNYTSITDKEHLAHMHVKSTGIVKVTPNTYSSHAEVTGITDKELLVHMSKSTGITDKEHLTYMSGNQQVLTSITDKEHL